VARRYVAWSERHERAGLVELRRIGLNAAELEPHQAPGVRILPLPECGDEWFFRRIFNSVALGSSGMRAARRVDLLAFMAAPNHDPHGIFLACVDGRFVGTAVGRRRPNQVGVIYNVAVHPAYRGRGVARALVRETLRYLQSQGCAEARLQTHPTNSAALRLYTTEGFETVD
jgi:ribosomal protein S18 acetylase RimI-like enzyme